MTASRRSLLAVIGPGVLVAATGVGAGDLATGALSGQKLGTLVLWAVVVGAAMKYVVSEGLTRWQLVTGDTIVEGACTHLGPVVRYGFLLFLLVWSFGVGVSLMSACGVAAHAIHARLVGHAWFDPVTDKVLYGMLHSLVALGLVWVGGYRLFERVTTVLVGVMFVTVVATAIAVGPAWGDVLRGLLWPTIPTGDGGEGIAWTVALIGGVGGTLTIVCYGYWIREEGRTSPDDLGLCRLDLATGYGVTALFGLAMVVIGASVGRTDAKGVKLLLDIATHLDTSLGTIGPATGWAFLIGAWGAIFSSLLGVWQCVPYLFADYWAFTYRSSGSGESGRDLEPGAADAPHGELAGVVDTSSPIYRGYLVAIATVPMLALGYDFALVQLWNSVLGALVVPLLAITLLVLNGRSKWIGERYRNGPLATLLLVGTLSFFVYALYHQFAS